MRTYEEYTEQELIDGDDKFFITANTKHLQNGVIQYFNEYLGFIDKKDKATIYEHYPETEAEQAFNSERFEGRVFIEDAVTGEEFLIVKNI